MNKTLLLISHERVDMPSEHATAYTRRLAQQEIYPDFIMGKGTQHTQAMRINFYAYAQEIGKKNPAFCEINTVPIKKVNGNESVLNGNWKNADPNALQRKQAESIIEQIRGLDQDGTVDTILVVGENDVMSELSGLLVAKEHSNTPVMLTGNDRQSISILSCPINSFAELTPDSCTLKSKASVGEIIQKNRALDRSQALYQPD